MFSYSSHVYIKTFWGSAFVHLGAVSFVLQKFIGLRAALSSKATLSLLTTDRIWTGPSTSTSLWCSLGHDGAVKSGVANLCGCPSRWGDGCSWQGVRPDAFGFHLGPNGGNLGLSIILFICLIISLALWACLHSNPAVFDAARPSCTHKLLRKARVVRKPVTGHEWIPQYG